MAPYSPQLGIARFGGDPCADAGATSPAKVAQLSGTAAPAVTSSSFTLAAGVAVAAAFVYGFTMQLQLGWSGI